LNLRDNRVAVTSVKSKEYPPEIPYDPPKNYPEYTGHFLNATNEVYAAVRDLFFRLDLDRNNYNTKNWNPLGDIIQPGMTVFLKPNIVIHKHKDKKNVFSIIVHASVLRPILDYICIALKNSGRIIIGESQFLFGQFEKAMVESHIQGLLEWYGNQTTIPIECIDLRINRGVRTYLYGKWGRVPVDQDPRGYRFVDLGDLSCFKDVDPKRLRIAIADHKIMSKHHSNGNHEYLFPKSFLDSDVIISIPKLKTHRRTSVTLVLKNFMGIPSLKDSLPHLITGSVSEGGDQYIYPSFRKRICTILHDQIQSNPFIPFKFACAVTKRIIWESNRILPFKDDIYEGMWYGNDTLWRTLLDLNRAAFYADKDGNICETLQRDFFCVIDGVIAGEKNGPLYPDPISAGVLLAGFNPVAVDATGASVMGFDIEKIPMIKKGLEANKERNPIFFGAKDDIKLLDGEDILSLQEVAKQKNLGFEAHPTWKGHVEIT
jgi:uncharacterized protein (DUF362 family)